MMIMSKNKKTTKTSANKVAVLIGSQQATPGVEQLHSVGARVHLG